MRKVSLREALARVTKEPIPRDWQAILDRAFPEASEDFRKESGQ